MSVEISKLQNEKQSLEQEILEQKLQGVKGQVMALGDTLHQRMDTVEQKNEIQFNHLKESTDEIRTSTREILAQVKQTNGRVTSLETSRIIYKTESEELTNKVGELEKNTKVVRFMHKYPKITVILVVSLYLFSIKEIRDVIGEGVVDIFGFFVKLF
jgi:chromosome segregation ATPase